MGAYSLSTWRSKDPGFPTVFSTARCMGPGERAVPGIVLKDVFSKCAFNRADNHLRIDSHFGARGRLLVLVLAPPRYSSPAFTGGRTLCCA